MGDRNFLNVFSKIKLSSNVKAILKNTTVQSVNLSEKDSSIKIFLESFEIFNEDCLNDFRDDIKDRFENILNIEIFVKYNLGNLTLSEKINKMNRNILSSIKSKSYLCFSILKNSKFILKENLLHISLPKNSSFIFKAKGIDTDIIKLIKERLDTDIFIVFQEIDDIHYKKEKKSTLEDAIKKSLEASTDKELSYETRNATDVKSNSRPKRHKKLSIKKSIENESLPIKNCIKENENVTIKGKIFAVEIIETKKGKYVIKADITDMTDSVSFKIFTDPKMYENEYKKIIRKGEFVIVNGTVHYDDYAKELILMATEICATLPPETKMDYNKNKRVELHLHTQMSKMNGISPVKDIVKRASEWGHKAIAITDYGVVQAFPEAMEASRNYDIKVIYGMEAYLIDDLVEVVINSRNQSLFEQYVIFDLETTGLNREHNKMIEIGAVKIKNGEIIDRFSSFINPNEKLNEKIIELTNITDDMLVGTPYENDVLPNFFEFFGDSVLVAHNANFDMGFIKKWAERNNKLHLLKNTVLDTVGLSRTLFPQMARHTLKALAQKLNVSLKNHHRAVDDAEATCDILIKCIDILKCEHNITSLDGINSLARVNIDVKKLRPTHAVMLVKNQQGLKNLYKLISSSNLNYFYREPRIPKSEFLKLKEGILIGTACGNGEFYQAILNNYDEDEIEKLADFYDYFEIQPISNNKNLIIDERISSVNNIQDLENINRKIVQYGEKYNKLVVATSDVHFLDKEDGYFREIILANKGNKGEQPPLYLRTTDEMLDEFIYLGEDKAYEVVVKNTNIIEAQIEEILPIPNGTFPPVIAGSDKELKEITTKKAKDIYGNDLPKIVEDRLNKELNSIIKNGFDVLYIIAKKIVGYSNENGYIVGSRGSVGSSFVATMADITEVNPLSPHYFCKNCKYSDFDSEEVLKYAGNSGWDLPDKVCPQCNNMLNKDGHDIPFETFLGFEGDKEPDIDLNFSGEFQLQAHQYTEDLFGKDHVFKAGTIGTLADKTAYGYVKKYIDEKEIKIRNAEINRLVAGCVGIKKTTGQHPGGLMVVPNDKSIYDFCPVQRPADDPKSSIITTHFDYHSISGRILKLDLLGHDVPTILRMLKDFTGFEPLDTPMDDTATMSLFTSPDALGVSGNMIGCKTGSLGLPEFGTPFVIQMLIDTQPNSFSDLIKISGLSHGTDVWFNNAQDLIKYNIATLKDVIPTRDDIMVYLILKGVESKLAFTIMEAVRKGKGLTPEFEKAMENKDVPEWYIKSCKKIKYMFPKGHAVAYVTNAFRMGYFKINYPEAFYASMFSVKVEDFDYDIMCFGIEKVEKAIKDIQNIGKNATTKEKSRFVVLELVREMYSRGIKFVKMDLYKSNGFKFDVLDDGILPPLCTIQGLGASTTNSIIEERKLGEFETIEKLVERVKVSKTVIEILKKNKVLEGIPDTNQISLF